MFEAIFNGGDLQNWFPIIDLNNTGSRIHMPQVKPAEMTNLEYQDGGQSAFSIDK